METTTETTTEITIETIAQSLTRRQKARLHEVADLMLQIFRTLERMRYLEPEWIQPGPHDLSEHMPLYTSLNLDPATIYLYHLLPYIDPVMRFRLDFYDGGNFVDYRAQDDVEQGRNPLYSDESRDMLRPWMTPLSLSGNHTAFIVYDAKRHVVGIYDTQNCGSYDRNLQAGRVFKTTREDGTERYFKEWDGVEEEATAEEWEEEINRPADDDDDDDDEEEEEDEGYESRSDEGEDDEEEEEEEEEEDEVWWDEMDARPAANVLRDVIRWYHELVEMPGQGESDWGRFDKKIVKPLYHKHGWPGEDFDGEAFLVDKARVEAAGKAQDNAARPFDELQRLRYQAEARGKSEPSDMAKLHEKLAAAKTVDEEW
jgi:hypothetical protein